MGTGYIPRLTTEVAMAVSRLFALFRGWNFRSKLVADLSFGKPYHRYDLTGKDTGNSWLTKDPEIVKNYYSDPRCTFIFTLNGFMGLFEAVQFSCNRKNVDKVPKDLPLFLLSGQDDPVGDFGEGVLKVVEMFRTADIRDITCKLYETDRHELLNELDKEIVYEDIFRWMKARI
jgi:alpha-beta hydrolase superfamily lysophospholipase